MSVRAKRVVVTLLILGLMGGGYLGLLYFRALNEKAALEDKIRQLEAKVHSFQKRYEEKSILADQTLRMRTAVEGRAHALQSELDEAQREIRALREKRDAEVSALLQEMKRKEASCQADAAKIRELTEALRKLSSEHSGLLQRVSQLQKEHESERTALQERNNDLESDLKRTRERLDRCEGHNARLCIIASELLEMYKNKGVFTSLLQAEPLTQFKKVELEKIVQEYEGRIQEERIAKRSGSKGNK